MTNLKEMFQDTAKRDVTNNGRLLDGTAQLTDIAGGLASELLKQLDERVDEYGELGKQSKYDSKAMDTLINEILDLENREPNPAEFLKELPYDTVINMLKSQQSKRSRAKSKVMTLDNYVSMVVASICEHLIRLTIDKPKGAGPGARRSTTVSFSDEQLANLRDDPDAIKRELRNLQSKKSIMRSRSDFSEDDQQFIALLVAENQLKELRDSGKRDPVRTDIAEILADSDITQLKGADAKEILSRIAELVK